MNAAEQREQQNGRVERIVLHLVKLGEHVVQLVAAAYVAEQQHGRKQRETARAGDGERHACAAPCVGPRWPEADQQERDEARQFPEDDEQQQVVRQHDAEHRAHEEQ
ncbi:hypothetical protein OKW39_001098 [Paraburkholderia sp. MM6662-R1]